MTSSPNRTTADKIALFRRFFSGLPNVYGTYDPANGRIRQVKQPVNDAVVLAHLRGKQPYGAYLLVGDSTRAALVDFDVPDLQPVIDVVAALRHYAIAAYIERSKSKGRHVWIFFPQAGVSAAKARAVLKYILAETGHADVELFPKQDGLDTHVAYGNFIFAPLNGRLVPRDRTIFVQSGDPTKPATNQWDFLERAERVPESRLDEVISLNDLRVGARPPTAPRTKRVVARSTFGLPACVQRILGQGVTDNQRVTCFRLAVRLKRVGLPRDLAGNLLHSWAAKNRPTGGKRIIISAEITAQLGCAYRGSYRSHRCEEPAMQLFCDPLCPIRSRAAVSPDVPVGPCARDPAKPRTRSTPMSTSPANQPVKEFRARNISLAIWQNEGIRHDQPVTLHSVTLNKRYRDPDTDEWKDTSSFFPDDLPRPRLLLDKAYEHILLREGGVPIATRTGRTVPTRLLSVGR